MSLASTASYPFSLERSNCSLSRVTADECRIQFYVDKTTILMMLAAYFRYQYEMDGKCYTTNLLIRDQVHDIISEFD